MAVDYCIIGSRLKQARIKAGLTQQELAEQTNLSVAFISRIERGSSHINLKRLSEFCTILNVSEGYILSGVSAPLSRLSRRMMARFFQPPITSTPFVW